MSQNYTYPPGFATASNPSVGPNGSPIPTSSTLIAGKADNGNLLPVRVDNSGKIEFSVESVEIGTVDQGTPNSLANAWPVEVTDGTNVLGTAAHPLRTDTTGTTTQPVSGTVAISSSALPTGASTSALQTTGNTSLSSIQTNISTRLSGSLVPTAYDEIALTYVPSGNGAGQIATAVYKLAGVTQKTLTMTYNGSDQLTDTLAS